MLKKLLLFSACFALVGGVGLTARSNTQGDKVPEYVPVPGWLQLPKGFKFGLATAVATDKDDNLFIFHRGKQPIAVFDKAGKFVHGWGDREVKTAHGLRIDPEGNIWTTDLSTHQVIKYDPAGKTLLTLGKRKKPGNTPGPGLTCPPTWPSPAPATFTWPTATATHASSSFPRTANF